MNYKKVLLLHFTQGLSGRSIAEVTGVSKSAINEFLKRFRESKELYGQEHSRYCVGARYHERECSFFPFIEYHGHYTPVVPGQATSVAIGQEIGAVTIISQLLCNASGIVILLCKPTVISLL